MLGRRLRDPERQDDHGRDRRRAERDRRGGNGPQVAPARERRGRVAEAGGDDGERAEEAAARHRADEQRDAAEADEYADEARSVDALRSEEEGGEERGEQRRAGLEQGGQPGVDARLAPGEEPEGHDRVEERDEEEGAEMGSDLGECRAERCAQRDDHDQCQRSQHEPTGNERRGLELLDPHLDEHERRSPDRRER